MGCTGSQSIGEQRFYALDTSFDGSLVAVAAFSCRFSIFRTADLTELLNVGTPSSQYRPEVGANTDLPGNSYLSGVAFVGDRLMSVTEGGFKLWELWGPALPWPSPPPPSMKPVALPSMRPPPDAFLWFAEK